MATPKKSTKQTSRQAARKHKSTHKNKLSLVKLLHLESLWVRLALVALAVGILGSIFVNVSGAASASNTSSNNVSTTANATNASRGVGKAPTPAGAVLLTTNSTRALNITRSGTAAKPRVYDGKGHTVGRITIKANYVVVQNFRIKAGGQYGAVLNGNHIVFRNNDIKGVKASGDGDLNAITLWGSDCTIANNTMDNFVSGTPPASSHTDGIQTWVSSSHPVAPINTRIYNNSITGPANKSRSTSIASIHQAIMVESGGKGGNSGGSTRPLTGWQIIGNTFGDSWNQTIKLNDASGAIIARNRFNGSSDKCLDLQGSKGTKFYSSNVIGPNMKSCPRGIAGAGPTIPRSFTTVGTSGTSKSSTGSQN